jgi:hypothetical protein
MCRQFLPSNQSDRKRRLDHVSIYHRYAADFDDNAKAQLGKIEKYFRTKNNIVRTIRNRASFHADPKVLTTGYEKFSDDEIFVDFHSQYRGHCLYFSSEIINLLGMIQLANKTDWKTGIDQIVYQTIEVADWFGDVILAFMTAFTMKHIEPTLDDVEEDKITINDGPPIDAVTIPFFCLPPARKKIIQRRGAVHMTTEGTIITAAVVLWFAQGWYLNTRLERVHKKLDVILEQFNGLRQYLYEKDPQFDDERELLAELNESLETKAVSFAGMNHMELTKRKKEQGRRTLNLPF